MKLEAKISSLQARMFNDFLSREMRRLNTETEYELALWGLMYVLQKAVKAALQPKPIPVDVIRCKECYALFERPIGLRSRKPKFCSDACRQRSYRYRRG